MAVIKTDVSEERITIRVTRIGELGTTLAVTSNRLTLRRNTVAMTMKNAVFWGITTQFLPHKKHITSPPQSLTG
jgi:hypothetical protein